MSTKRITLLIFSAIILFGCRDRSSHNSASEIISINPHQAADFINLSEIADSVKIIRLVTNPEDVLGRVREIVIKDKYIYAIDAAQQAVFVFDKSGKFVSKLAKMGNGAGEYQFMTFVFIDDNEEFIEIVNFRGTESQLYKYKNISFDFIGHNPIIGFSANSCKRIGNTYYYAAQQLDNIIDGNKTNTGLFIVKDYKVVKTSFDKIIETRGSGFSPNGESFAINDKGELFISVMYDNTFYKIVDETVTPAVTVDFGKYGMKNSIGLEPMKKQMEYIKGTNGVATFPVLNLNNTDIMSFSYYFRQDADRQFYKKEDLYYYIKLKNKAFHTKRIKNDITNFPSSIYLDSYFPFCVHQVYYNDYLVDVYVPSDVLLAEKDGPNKIFVEGLGEITIDDNPIIVMMKLKK